MPVMMSAGDVAARTCVQVSALRTQLGELRGALGRVDGELRLAQRAQRAAAGQDNALADEVNAEYAAKLANFHADADAALSAAQVGLAGSAAFQHRF
jgi:predicted 2-oxoglutarate/Fe(II)-dependent dioxygenase YbiX